MEIAIKVQQLSVFGLSIIVAVFRWFYAVDLRTIFSI